MTDVAGKDKNGVFGSMQSVRVDFLVNALEEDFVEDLPKEVAHDRRLSPHPSVLWDVPVLERVLALPDQPFSDLLLVLAMPACEGLDVFFDPRILPRIAALDQKVLYGRLLKGARQLAGFSQAERDFRACLKAHVEAAAQASGLHAGLAIITAPDLDARTLAPITYIVDEILPMGATLFVGKAKDGKSLAMWHLCVAVAEGGVVFGRYQAAQGAVLYLALEDGERRAQRRLRDQMAASGMTAAPAALDVVVWDAPLVGDGLEEALTAWLDTHADAQLIVIDILEKVRPKRTKGGSVYHEDYWALASLQRLAQERGIALVVVHHANKVKSEDFRDVISGSMSLAGAADTLWVLQRLAGETAGTLRITGRDVESMDVALQFEEGLWTAVDGPATAHLSPESRAVVEALEVATIPLGAKHLAQLLGVPDGTMRVRLCRLVDRGILVNVGPGQYGLPEMGLPPGIPEGAPAVMPVTPVTPVMPVMPVTDAGTVPDVTPVTAITPVTPVTALHGNGATNGHTMLIPCANCGATERWDHNGTMRCVRCWPPERC